MKFMILSFYDLLLQDVLEVSLDSPLWIISAGFGYYHDSYSLDIDLKCESLLKFIIANVARE